MLELRGLVGLGVAVADLLELLRALAGHRVAAHPADEEQALGLGQPAGQLGQRGLLGEHLGDLVGQPLQPGDQPAPVGDREVADPAELEREQREAEEHVGQRLGRGDRDLGAGVQVDAAVALAGDRRARRRSPGPRPDRPCAGSPGPRAGCRWSPRTG